MSIVIVVGTRPEIIKMCPIIRACLSEQIPFVLIHTGQHYSYEMDRVFFEQLELPDPDFRLDVGSGLHGEQTAKMLAGIEQILLAETPKLLLVEGDTNSVLAGALAAAKLHIPVGHVEAGLRSRDMRMPEELNRIMVDHISDYLFAPTQLAASLLEDEGIPGDRVHITGNTIVDAVRQNKALANERSDILNRLGLDRGRFILITAHRQENVDVASRFKGILEGARAVGDELGIPVVYPIHPRSRKMLTNFKIDPIGIHLIDPVNFLDFLQLESQARLVLTDSGGVQEEACILGVPCVTLRDNTERPETLAVGANVLAGANKTEIFTQSLQQVEVARGWEQPFGDGLSGQRIVSIVQEQVCGS